MKTFFQNKLFLGILVVLNLVVLLGQLWPEGAPPFARAVNIIFLVFTLLLILSLLTRRK